MYDKAIELYTKAIELNPSIAVYYGNRSIAYLRTECFGYALTDASKAIELDRNYVKGYYRRAAAYMSLGKFKLALTDYKTVVKAIPNNKDAKDRFMECSKMVKVLAFQKAISVEEKKNIADMINLEAMGEYSTISTFLKQILIHLIVNNCHLYNIISLFSTNSISQFLIL